MRIVARMQQKKEGLNTYPTGVLNIRVQARFLRKK